MAIAMFLACGGTTQADQTATLRGTVTMIEGDCGPTLQPHTCTVSTPSRAVYLYPVQYLPSDGSFPTSVDVAPIVTTQSGSDGKYEMHAPPGEWSVFVEDQSHPYAFEVDTEKLDYVELTIGVETTFDIEINHARD